MRHFLLLLFFAFQCPAICAQDSGSVHPEVTYDSFYRGMLKALKKNGGQVLVDKNVFPPAGEYLHVTFETTAEAHGYAMVVTYWAADGPPTAYFNYGSASAHDDYFKSERMGEFGAMILKMGNAPGRTGHIYLKKNNDCGRETCMVHLMVVTY